MQEKLLSISFNPGKLKLVESKKNGGLSIEVWSIEKFSPESGIEEQARVLNQILEKNKINTRKAVIIPPRNETYYQLVEIPHIPEKEIHSAIKFSLGNSIPIPGDDTVFAYQKLAKLEQKERQIFFVAAIPKKTADNIKAVLDKCGLSIQSIVPACYALKNNLKDPAPSSNILVYFAGSTSLIVLTQKGEIVFSREISVGGDNLTQAIVGEKLDTEGKVEFDFLKSEDLKIKFGIPLNVEEYSTQSGISGQTALSMMRPVIEKIVSEINRTIEYYRTQTADQSQFEKIYFTGGSSKTKNLLELLSKEIELPIAAFPPIVSTNSPEFNEALPFLSLNLGGLFTPTTEIDLTPDNYKTSGKKLDKETFSLEIGAMVILLILGLVTVGLAYFVGLQKKEISSLEAQKGPLLEAAKPQRSEVIAKQIISSYGNKDQTDRFIYIMKNIENITPNDIYFKSISYNNKLNQLFLKGIVVEGEKESGISKLIENLKALGGFTTIDITALNKSKLYTVPTYDFELRCQLVGTPIGAKK